MSLLWLCKSSGLVPSHVEKVTTRSQIRHYIRPVHKVHGHYNHCTQRLLQEPVILLL